MTVLFKTCDCFTATKKAILQPWVTADTNVVRLFNNEKNITFHNIGIGTQLECQIKWIERSSRGAVAQGSALLYSSWKANKMCIFMFHCIRSTQTNTVAQ